MNVANTTYDDHEISLKRQIITKQYETMHTWANGTVCWVS